MIFVTSLGVALICLYIGYVLGACSASSKSQYTDSRVCRTDTLAREYLATAVGGFCGGVVLGLIWFILFRR